MIRHESPKTNLNIIGFYSSTTQTFLSPKSYGADRRVIEHLLARNIDFTFNPMEYDIPGAGVGFVGGGRGGQLWLLGCRIASFHPTLEFRNCIVFQYKLVPYFLNLRIY